MRAGRLLLNIMLVTAATCLLSSTAFAWFGFGDDTGKSGLDLNRGYDVNTVATITGRVVSSHRSGDQETIIEIKSGSETVNLYVGPGSYWDKNGIKVKANDEISAKGSRAQGKDGKSYLLTQKLVNRTTDTQLELRNETGQPGWLPADSSSSRSYGGRGSPGGGMMRGGGGGGMMRGGGGSGMMRR
ncbi:MAG: DNA-binding protein [Desulfuromonadaceae bacterium]|nr:DNA-binding protein [Desulfuromonadaceae bacterium]